MFFQLEYLFTKLNQEFPLSTMSKSFRGSHSITNVEGLPELNLWANGRHFAFGLEVHDLESLEAIEKLVADLRIDVDKMLAPKNFQKNVDLCR